MAARGRSEQAQKRLRNLAAHRASSGFRDEGPPRVMLSRDVVTRDEGRERLSLRLGAHGRRRQADGLARVVGIIDPKDTR